jgi:hypothetical protein
MRRKRAGEIKGKGNSERKGQDSMYYLHGSMLLFRFANAIAIPHAITLWVLDSCTRE